jgi:hypothetical protein
MRYLSDANILVPIWKKQIGVKHTREGIRQGCQPAGQVEGKQLNNRRGGKGAKARNTGALERNLSITITSNQSSMVRETLNGNFGITASRKGTAARAEGGK